MFVLRMLIPVLACYATDSVIFDGDYFREFAERFDASAAVETVADVAGAVHDAWNEPPNLEYTAATRLCSGSLMGCR